MAGRLLRLPCLFIRGTGNTRVITAATAISTSDSSCCWTLPHRPASSNARISSKPYYGGQHAQNRMQQYNKLSHPEHDQAIVDRQEPTEGENNSPGTSNKPKLVIFDKNGTLINFNVRWIPWVKDMAKRLEQATGLNLQKEIFSELDVCEFTYKARPGLLADGTTSQIKRALGEVLCRQGMTRHKALSHIESCWQDIDVTGPNTLQTEANLRHILQSLRNNGIKTAVCTSDTRKSTERTLQLLHLTSYFDELFCGDDPDLTQDNADGELIKLVCGEFGVLPEDTVVIGDTHGDMIMGKSAGVSMTIGVLSGIGTRLSLAQYADHIVDGIDQVLPFILKEQTVESNNSTDVNHRAIPAVSNTDLDVHRVEPTTDITGYEVEPAKKASLVIFDKDGTLICFHTTWTPIAEGIIERLEQETGLTLRHSVLKALGYCQESQMWKPGLFAEGTTGQNKERLFELLQQEGLEETEARKVIEQVWKDAYNPKKKTVKVLDDPSSLFQILKDNDVKIAICTADSRASTMTFLESSGLLKYVDHVVCGDDEGTKPKPAPNNALNICSALGVDPKEAVVVGDTAADIGMGRAAKLGASVAVLSGVGDVKNLDSHGADHIIPSIKHILKLVVNEETAQDYDSSESGK